MGGKFPGPLQIFPDSFPDCVSLWPRCLCGSNASSVGLPRHPWAILLRSGPPFSPSPDAPADPSFEGCRAKCPGPLFRRPGHFTDAPTPDNGSALLTPQTPASVVVNP